MPVNTVEVIIFYQIELGAGEEGLLNNFLLIGFFKTPQVFSIVKYLFYLFCPIFLRISFCWKFMKKF